jgi:hypothetical protein
MLSPRNFCQAVYSEQGQIAAQLLRRGQAVYPILRTSRTIDNTFWVRMNLAPFPAWRLKLRKADDSLEGQRQFHDLRTLLCAAALLREERPDLRLIIAAPSEASGEDRGFIQMIANRVSLNSE